MELSDLVIFSKVAENGSISRTAEQLNRVPSNITARVKKLELELGKSLFIREKNRLRLAPSGEQLLRYSSKIIALADEAVAQLHHQKPIGRLRLGSMEAVAASRLSGVLQQYHASFPEVILEVQTRPTGDLIDQVLSGQLDLALVADPEQDQRLEIFPLFAEELVVVSDLQHAPITTANDLGARPTLLGFNASCVYRNRLADWVKDAELMPRVIEINSYHALLNCVTAGMGVGIVPAKLLEFYAFVDSVQTHPLPDPWRVTTTSLIWRRDSITPAMRAFGEQISSFSNIPV